MAGEIEIQHRDVCGEDGCTQRMDLEVLHTPAGYYLGTSCPIHGPYGRESHYFPTYEQASEALDQWLLGNRVNARDTDYHPAPIEVHHFDTSAEFEEFAKRYYPSQEDE
jgi:hypothetical protein